MKDGGGGVPPDVTVGRLGKRRGTATNDGDGSLSPRVAVPRGGRAVAQYYDDDINDSNNNDDAGGGGIGLGGGGGIANASREGTTSTVNAVALPPARLAHLESVVGNACRDVMLGAGSTNARVHGLLIAALSVMTSRMLSREGVEGMMDDTVEGIMSADNVGLFRHPSSPMTKVASARAEVGSIAALDRMTDDATDPLAPLLQVGALLWGLPRRSDDGIPGEFVLDEGLLRYFAVAASTYEERIEIQKANLFRTQSSSVTHPVGASLSTRNPPSLSSVV